MRKVKDYQRSAEAIRVVSETAIALLAGISGAGKDTIKNKLLQSADFRDIVSYTTRAPRENNGTWEVDGINYHFVSKEAISKLLDAHAFIEAKLVHEDIYGTSIEEVKQADVEHKIALTDIDVQGIDEYKDISKNVIAIFLVPPDHTTWLARLKKRYATQAEFEAEWPKRRESAIHELSHALEVPYYHFVINDDLERAATITDKIAHKDSDTFNRGDDEARLRAHDLLDAIERAV